MLRLDYNQYLNNSNFKIEDTFFSNLLGSNYKFKSKFKTVEERYNNHKKFNPMFKKIFFKITFKSIILAKNEELEHLIKLITDNMANLNDKQKKAMQYQIKNIFNYSTKFQSSVITPFFTNNFNFRVCFYCNKDFIHNFKKEDKEVSTFQLDHFYDKGTYPYLALSFYNLIPSCPTCNSSKVKGTENCFSTCKAPNSDSFDFNEKVKFKIFLDSTCRDLNIKEIANIDIPLKENHSNKYDKYIEVFKLNERYKVHKDIVLDMIQKAELYPTSRLKELEDLTGIPYQQIKKDIFNLIDKDEDLSKKQFSKLIKDVSEELGLV